MKVSYRIKFIDLILFNIYHLFHSPFMLGVFVILIGAIVYLDWQVLSENVDSYSRLIRLLSFAVSDLVLIALAGIVLCLMVLLSNFSRMNKTVLTDFVITLHPDSISAESSYLRAEYQWAAIQKLAQSPEYLFLYTMQHGAVIIPKRAFQSIQDLEHFWQECQDRVPGA